MQNTLAAPAHSELVVRKSRFIGCVEPVDGRAAALVRVSALRSAHPGAAHVCWALMAGGNSAANDDGEPGGTAGRPMLEVLRHHRLGGVLATAVRYFGGIKLGAGGLVRAYTDTVAQALLGATAVPLVHRVTMQCAVPYALEGVVRRELAQAGAAAIAVQHRSLVHFSFDLAQPEMAPCAARLDDACQGRVAWGS